MTDRQKNCTKSQITKSHPETKAIVKKFTEAETRNMIKEYLKADCDPNVIFKNAAKQLETYTGSNNKKEVEKIKKELVENSDKHLMALGLETHYALAEMTAVRYRPLVIEVARQIEKEYDCKTPSEKVLTEIVAGAYVKIIEFSKRFNDCTNIEFLSNEKNGYYTMLSKEVDKAHRQLIMALTTLKQIKNPPVEFNVKAKTAFLAQNQQINAVNNPVQQDENINPK